MEFRNYVQSEITLTPTNNTGKLSCPMPIELQRDLLSKRVGVEEMVIDTSSIPQFVPKVMVTQGNGQAQNYKANATTDYSLPPTGTINMNLDVLQYWINLRKKDNSVNYRSLVMWNDPNNLPAPNLGLIDTLSVYTMPYYFCYNFMDFLRYVADAIDIALAEMTGNPLPAGYGTVFNYDADSDTYQLSVATTYMNDWDLEFSDELFNLFRFSATSVNVGTNTVSNAPWTTHRINFTELVDADNISFSTTTCRAKNNIFPFDLAFLTSNLPTAPTTFYLSQNMSNSYENAFNILIKWRLEKSILLQQEFFRVKPDNLANRVKSFIKNESNQERLEVQFMFRTRDEGAFIRWKFPSDFNGQISLTTFSVI